MWNVPVGVRSPARPVVTSAEPAVQPSSKKIADWVLRSTSMTLPFGTAFPHPTALSAAFTEPSSAVIADDTESRRAEVPPSRNFVDSDAY